MNALEIIKRLENFGGKVTLEGDELIIRGPRSAMMPELREALRCRKAEIIAFLKSARPDFRGDVQHLPSCGECPWYLHNPWTHYPELRGWCGYWWDYLLGPHNPQCRDRRESWVPDPEAKAQPNKHKTLKRIRPETAAGTCYDCRHFQPGASSPNPTQAWGWCRHLGKGRYGVARTCDAFVAERRAKEA